MATCPSCGINSRDESEPIQVIEVFIIEPAPGDDLEATFARSAENGMKMPARRVLVMTCRCGWSIEGDIAGGAFMGFPETQTWPPGAPPTAERPE